MALSMKTVLSQSQEKNLLRDSVFLPDGIFWEKCKISLSPTPFLFLARH